MSLNPRVLALLLALVVSIVTTSFLGFIDNLDIGVVLLVLIVSFVATYILVFLTLEFLVFREIKRIHSLLAKLRMKDFSFSEISQTNIVNPLQGINNEITTYASLKQKEIEDLKKMEIFRKELIANISHELKTPIFAAQGFVHTLLDGAVHDKQVRKKFLKKAAKSLDSLDILVQDLLVLSQIETGDIRMNFEYFDLKKLVIDTIEQFEDKALKKNIKLTCGFSGDDHDFTVYGDWQRIKQVLNNLISNGIIYTNEGGQVAVVLNKLELSVNVAVIDDGIGIPDEDKTRIFERFYRVDKSRSRGSGGTGLGLAIVKHIVENHNTSINLKSSPGTGSEFSFELSITEGDYL